MDNKRQRPINLNPFSIQLPLPALISITHRLSGIFVFIGIPLLLAGLQLSLSSKASFENLQNKLASPALKVILGLFLAALLFHLLAGIRHLMMDLEIMTSLKAGRLSAQGVVILFLMSMVYLSLLLGGFL